MSFGFGFGILDDIGLLNRFSVEVDWMRSCPDARWSYLVPSTGIGFKIPECIKKIPIEDVRFETGYAVDIGPSSGKGAAKFAMGIESATIPLGFTYAGVCFRLKVQRIHLQKKLDGVFLEMVLY